MIAFFLTLLMVFGQGETQCLPDHPVEAKAFAG
jgi:hypothetical protein